MREDEEDDWAPFRPKKRREGGTGVTTLLAGVLVLATVLSIIFMQIVPLGTAGCAPDCAYGLLFTVDRSFPIVAVGIFIASMVWASWLHRHKKSNVRAPLSGLAVLLVTLAIAYFLETVAMQR